jgi:hypothetical protein
LIDIPAIITCMARWFSVRNGPSGDRALGEAAAKMPTAATKNSAARNRDERKGRRPIALLAISRAAARLGDQWANGQTDIVIDQLLGF